MPVLDAKALKTDPEGTALLRDVLRRDKTAAEPLKPRHKRSQTSKGEDGEAQASTHLPR
jgi:hypothetical protein